MCGIAGFFDLASRRARPDAAEIAGRQISTIRHRGPDAAGLHLGPGLAMAHARLSIIDTSSAANQPMLDASGDLAIVFNGEIYNFAELRSELETKGHRFRTRSDTEVILEGYRAWGIDVVKRLRGMFAIVLHDGPRDRLVLMRDRLGKKPLFHGTSGGVFVFGSEAKAVLAFPGMRREADLAAIDAFLTYQAIPGELCAFDGLARLPPAHVGVIERGDRLKLERYWSLPRPSSTRRRPDAEVREQLIVQLEEATRARLVADVPLGAFLSGGVDSSAVVAMMARASAEPVRTFTIGFESADHDERAWARQVASRYGTRHEELEVTGDAVSTLDDLAYHFDEPFADASAVPTWHVSRIARERVTVALSGDGGDESFIGYERYSALARLDRLQGLPKPLQSAARAAFSLMPEGVDRIRLLRRLRRIAGSLGGNRSQRYAPFVACFDDDQKRALYSPGMATRLGRSALDRLEPFLEMAETMPMAAAWADIHTYLPDVLLTKVDIASMANSLEVRSPFLDHQLMEWAANLPESQRFPGGEPKGLLKKALEPYLPSDLLYRPKMGFAAPIDGWLDDALAARLEDTLLGGAARQRGLFSAGAVERMIGRHRKGERQGYRLWALMMLEMWFQRWIDAPDPFAGRLLPMVEAQGLAG